MLKHIRRWFFKRKVNQVIDTISHLDRSMIKLGYSRCERRRFWRETFKDRILVVDVLRNMGQEA
jgi:hypothetical protein